MVYYDMLYEKSEFADVGLRPVVVLLSIKGQTELLGRKEGLIWQ